MYTAETLWHRIETNAEITCSALVQLYYRQTADEQEGGYTEHSNGRGFNAADAYILTSFALQVIGNRKRREAGQFDYPTLLSPKQLVLTRRKLRKYLGQLVEIANNRAQEQAPTPVPVTDVRAIGVTTPVPVEDRRSSRDWPTALVREGNVLRWKTAEEMYAQAGGFQMPVVR